MLRLLREDEKFRLAVAGLLRLDELFRELRRLRKDFNAFVKEQAKGGRRIAESETKTQRGRGG